MEDKIKPILNLDDGRISEKLMECGFPKEKADELGFHFFEIERFCLGFRKTILNIIEFKDKKKIIEELDDLQGELDTHILNNHLIPAESILDEELNKEDNEK